MNETVADRLRRARRRRFVGRAAELELVRAALEAPEPPFGVLWVHGPGGVGKTMLLAALAEVAEAAGRDVRRIDLRGVEPSPAAARAALGMEDGAGATAWNGRAAPVLLLDTFEAAFALEDWLRDELVPTLPAGTLMVIAGRRGPGDGWRRDPGWAELLRVVSLRNLDPHDSRAYLRTAGVAEALHDRVLELTHGHPLALALLVEVLSQRRADAGPEALDLGAVPDVLGRLLADFLAGVPSERHRSALELAAHARFTTEDLVRSALGEDDAAELFAWLRGLAFTDAGPHGVFPHDLARDVIDADLRWRDPARYEDLHRRIRRHVVERLSSRGGRRDQQAMIDLIFMHRHNPATRAMWDWESLGQVYADAVRPADRDAILAMTERHEGAASAEIAAYWLDRRPEAFAAFRSRGPRPIGFMTQLALHEADEADLARDPGARAAWEHVIRHAPPRPGEEVLLGRFFIDAEAHQAPSPGLNVVTARTTAEWLARPALAWYLIAWADPVAAAPMMAYVHFARAPGADFEVGGRAYGVFARDWRRGGAVGWLDAMAERELATGAEPAPPPAEPAAEVALSKTEFAAAVRRGLRDVHDRVALARNPLLRARVLAGAAGPREPEALAALLREAVAALGEDPHADRLVRALDRTYLRPAPTQEAAADLLGLPFSTYRGHLARGLERVVEWLWRRELYGPDG